MNAVAAAAHPVIRNFRLFIPSPLRNEHLAVHRFGML